MVEFLNFTCSSNKAQSCQMSEEQPQRAMNLLRRAINASEVRSEANSKWMVFMVRDRKIQIQQYNGKPSQWLTSVPFWLAQGHHIDTNPVKHRTWCDVFDRTLSKHLRLRFGAIVHFITSVAKDAWYCLYRLQSLSGYARNSRKTTMHFGNLVRTPNKISMSLTCLCSIFY